VHSRSSAPPLIVCHPGVIRTVYQATLAPVVLAFTEFWSGDPVPTRYNRHATAHATGAIQVTKLNAIAAILLATSLLRELYEQDAETNAAT